LHYNKIYLVSFFKHIGIKMLLASEQIAPEWNVIMTATVIAMLPPLIVLLVLRKSFV